MAITKRSAMNAGAEKPKVTASPSPAATPEKKSVWAELSKHVMTGISNMIPFLIMGGLILAMSQLIPYVILGVDPSIGIVDAMNTGKYTGFSLGLLQFANLTADFGGTLFGFAIPMFAAFMANSIGGRLAFPAGFIGGLMATKPTAVLSIVDGKWATSAPVASTFLGAILIALAAGYFVKWLNKVIKVSHNMLAFKTTFLIPILAAVAVMLGMKLDVSTFKDKNGKTLMYAAPSNLSPASDEYKKLIAERVAKIKAANPDKGNTPIPEDLVTGSGSGLDPHISPAAAQYQVERIAKARGISADKVNTIVLQYTNKKLLGVFGEETVNVLQVNLALDGILK